MRAMKSGSFSLFLALFASMGIAGCSKSAQSPAASNFTQQPSSSSGAAAATAPEQSSAPASAQSQSFTQSQRQANTQPASAPAPPPQPTYITVPAGTNLHVVLDHSISTATAHAGDTFTATLVQPVMAGGQAVIPLNARVAGHVVDSVASGRLSRQAQLVLTLDSVRVNGQSYNLQTDSVTRLGAAHKKRDIIAIGGGSALGAIIGGIAGGLVAATFGERLSASRLFVLSAVVFGVIDLGIALYPLALVAVWPAFAGMILVGVPAAFMMASMMTLFQRHAADAYRGRVWGAEEN